MNYRTTCISVVIVSALSACAIPKKPDNREEWSTIHSKTYDGVSIEQALSASEKILKLADHDFSFEYPPNILIARRSWSVYAVLMAENGQDYWRIEGTTLGESTTLLVQISRQANAITPSPVVGFNDGINAASIQSNTMPGTEIFWSGPYHLFWARLDYMLGKSSKWITCKDANNLYPSEFNGNDTGVLCGVTSDDHNPDYDFSKASNKQVHKSAKTRQ